MCVSDGVSIVCMCVQVKQMAHKDSRIKLVNEILNGIKVRKETI